MSTKNCYLFGLIVVGLVLGTSFYLQMYDGFEPCPLCTLQRFAFGALGIVFFLGFLLARGRLSRVIFSILTLLFAVAGMLTAGRQVYLQLFTKGDNEACGVSLQYMLQVLPFNEAVSKIFAGSAECTQRGSEFFLMNMAEWSMLLFVGFVGLGGWLLLKRGE